MATGEKGEPLTIQGAGYVRDTQTAVLRSGLSSADSIDTDAHVVAIAGLVEVRGRPNISVSGRFSNASATCKVTVFLLSVNADGTYYIKDRSAETTLTAPSATFGTKYMAPTAIFDSMGASHAIIALSGATSAGTVDLGAGTF